VIDFRPDTCNIISTQLKSYNIDPLNVVHIEAIISKKNRTKNWTYLKKDGPKAAKGLSYIIKTLT
jgi:hypothetical protein